jgi:transcriptional regulator with XRE-family HTH domain
LKAAIGKSGLTHYAVGRLASVSPTQIDRFMSGERDLRLATAAAIAEALGLELRHL